jgi:NAD(P)-dependent dehydrogenase (short-subunit alcohol dehydrogenase family)
MTQARRFENQSILVTGASSGIGRATALALGREGASLIAAGRRRDRLEEVATQVRQAGGRCEIVTGDVRQEAVAQAWAAEAVKRHGGLDGLVNAAGVIGNTGLLNSTPEEWDRVMDSNLRSVFLMTKAAARVRRKGAVVNLLGGVPRPTWACCCIAEPGGRGQLTRCTALELAAQACA